MSPLIMPNIDNLGWLWRKPEPLDDLLHIGIVEGGILIVILLFSVLESFMFHKMKCMAKNRRDYNMETLL